MERDPRPGVPTTELIREAIGEARELVRLEVALGKDEVRRELVEARGALIAFGVALLTGILTLALLLVALAIAIEPDGRPAAAIGLILAFITGLAVTVGWQLWPRRPLHETRRRLKVDAGLLRERTA